MTRIEKIWIEAECFIYEEGQDPEDSYCNVEIHLDNGSLITLNVWSEDFFKEQVNSLDWINEQVAILPDLVIKDFDSLSIREAIYVLFEEHRWFKGRGYPVPNEEND